MKRPERLFALPPLLLAAALLAPSAALAGDMPTPERPAAEPVGAPQAASPAQQRQAPPPGGTTRRLLEQQRAGHHASSNDQWLSGDVQREVYRRYVDSFSRPIPETFIDDDFSN
ncbi:DUF3613 domain-containing protein [uncultured Halomonas sp.]|uniref:DUF3613 domain-containing protein n=1 Tax=uncultured Halomonas sp. TaxID=173971 RepID=UPI002615D6A1|nr:DUF3613 domain-containing protein [uncultured Halomonas sp.]